MAVQSEKNNKESHTFVWPLSVVVALNRGIRCLCQQPTLHQTHYPPHHYKNDKIINKNENNVKVTLAKFLLIQVSETEIP